MSKHEADVLLTQYKEDGWKTQNYGKFYETVEKNGKKITICWY